MANQIDPDLILDPEIMQQNKAWQISSNTP